LSSVLPARDGDWPPHRAVAWLPGTLPLGGVVPDTPIHAFEAPAPRLALARAGRCAPTRQDIDLAGLLAFEVRGLLDAHEADAIVEASERFGYRDEAPGIHTPPGMRMNKSVHWVADPDLMVPLFARMAHLLPARIDGLRLWPRLSERINMYRYDDGDVFNRHTDGDWPGFSLGEDRRTMVQWPGAVRSCLTMLLYLNGPEDGVQGGHTRLFGADGRAYDVTPSKGSALFFRHGFGPASVLHIGCPVHGPVPKYVARINVMYAPD
jgi:hypothetical protein